MGHPAELLLVQMDINLCSPADQTDIDLCLPTELLVEHMDINLYGHKFMSSF